MHTSGPGTDPAEMVTVRYWAGARAAAGVAEERLAGVATVDDLVTHLAQSRPGLLAVLPVCSVLVGGRASSGGDQIAPGAVVEVLPPFAGG
jgi:molybdopterin synthase sulfur carrier subunit